MTPEGALKAEVLKYLQGANVFFLRMNSGKVKVRGGYIDLHPTGTSDFLVCRVGELPAWVELKAKGQSTAAARKKAQAEFGERVKQIGHRYAIVTSVDELTAFLGAESR